jgi:hypothetical protein
MTLVRFAVRPTHCLQIVTPRLSAKWLLPEPVREPQVPRMMDLTWTFLVVTSGKALAQVKSHLRPNTLLVPVRS